MVRNIIGSKPSTAVSTASANMTYHGGPLIPNVQVVTIYWGTFWTNNLLQPKLDSFFDFAVNSSMIDQLAEYSANGVTIARGQHVASAIITNNDPGSSVDDSTIQSFIQGLINSGMVPPVNQNTLYFVFTPSGTVVTQGGASSCQQFCGYHNSNGNMYYAVIPFPDCSGCNFASTVFDSLTVISSHELSEAITDPSVGTGWFDDNTGFEIGDVCEGSNKTVSSMSVAVEPAANAVNFTLTVDGFDPVSGTLTPTGTPPPPPPPPVPSPSVSYVVQTEWSNVQGRCV